MQNPISKQVNKPLRAGQGTGRVGLGAEHPTGNEQLPQNRHEGLGMQAMGQTDPMQPQIQPCDNRDGGGLHSGQVMSEREYIYPLLLLPPTFPQTAGSRLGDLPGQ